MKRGGYDGRGTSRERSEISMAEVPECAIIAKISKKGWKYIARKGVNTINEHMV